LFFWRALESFDAVQRRRFVRFAWAQERLPIDDAEFVRTGARMLIKPYDIDGDPNKAFPRADTCVTSLKLRLIFCDFDSCCDKSIVG
jgi:hypothetical protein